VTEVVFVRFRAASAAKEKLSRVKLNCYLDNRTNKGIYLQEFCDINQVIPELKYPEEFLLKSRL
jgi:uncharacterized protein (DUF927 family)